MDITNHLLHSDIMDTTEISTMDPFVDIRSMSPQPQTVPIPIKQQKISNGAAFSRSPSYRQDLQPARIQKSQMPHLPYVTSQSGLVYDVRMRFHVEIEQDADQGVHPEDPRRIWSIYKELVDAGLVDDPNTIELSEHVLGRIPARFATEEEICAVHTKRHYDWVVALERKLSIPHIFAVLTNH